MAKKNSEETGLKLRNCRTRKGYSQQFVADNLGINRTTYTYYETGRSEPSLKTMVRLAQIFEVNIAEILPMAIEDAELMDGATYVCSLTSDERSLLEHFRSFSDEGKAEILGIITNMQSKAD